MQTNVGVLRLHEKLPCRVWRVLSRWHYLHDSSRTRSMWGTPIPILYCKAWLAISWHWWISGKLFVILQSIEWHCQFRQNFHCMFEICFLDYQLLNSCSVMISICWKVWERQQKQGDTPSGVEVQIMQVLIIPGHMNPVSFAMVEIMMATMAGSSLIGTLEF